MAFPIGPYSRCWNGTSGQRRRQRSTLGPGRFAFVVCYVTLATDVKPYFILHNFVVNWVRYSIIQDELRIFLWNKPGKESNTVSTAFDPYMNLVRYGAPMFLEIWWFPESGSSLKNCITFSPFVSACRSDLAPCDTIHPKCFTTKQLNRINEHFISAVLTANVTCQLNLLFLGDHGIRIFDMRLASGW